LDQFPGVTADVLGTTAGRCGSVGSALHRLFTQGFAVAKRVRTETAVAQHAVSVPYAAVELAKMNQGIPRLSVANRMWSRAVEVARALAGTPVLFDRWAEELAGADIVITSARVRQPLVTVETVWAVLKTRRSRPFLFMGLRGFVWVIFVKLGQPSHRPTFTAFTSPSTPSPTVKGNVT
jgi:glutamyl-tRNA reductase